MRQRLPIAHHHANLVGDDVERGERLGKQLAMLSEGDHRAREVIRGPEQPDHWCELDSLRASSDDHQYTRHLNDLLAGPSIASPTQRLQRKDRGPRVDIGGPGFVDDAAGGVLQAP